MRSNALMWLVYALPVCVIAAVFVVIAVTVMLGLLRARATMNRAMQPPPAPPAPRTKPVVLWAAGAYGLWTGGEDSGSWARQRCIDSLKSWYGAEDRAALLDVITDLERGTTGNQAWDLVRAMDLLRIGAGAGYLSDDECWARIAAEAQMLRQNYRSWEELAGGFESGMNAWHDQRGITDPAPRARVQRNLPGLRANQWPKIAYGAAL